MTIESCSFWDNFANRAGGAFFAEFREWPLTFLNISNCLFRGNSAGLYGPDVASIAVRGSVEIVGNGTAMVAEGTPLTFIGFFSDWFGQTVVSSDFSASLVLDSHLSFRGNPSEAVRYSICATL